VVWHAPSNTRHCTPGRQHRQGPLRRHHDHSSSSSSSHDNHSSPCSCPCPRCHRPRHHDPRPLPRVRLRLLRDAATGALPATAALPPAVHHPRHGLRTVQAPILPVCPAAAARAAELLRPTTAGICRRRVLGVVQRVPAPAADAVRKWYTPAPDADTSTDTGTADANANGPRAATPAGDCKRDDCDVWQLFWWDARGDCGCGCGWGEDAGGGEYGVCAERAGGERADAACPFEDGPGGAAAAGILWGVSSPGSGEVISMEACGCVVEFSLSYGLCLRRVRFNVSIRVRLSFSFFAFLIHAYGSVQEEQNLGRVRCDGDFSCSVARNIVHKLPFFFSFRYLLTTSLRRPQLLSLVCVLTLKLLLLRILSLVRWSVGGFKCVKGQSRSSLQAQGKYIYIEKRDGDHYGRKKKPKTGLNMYS
jgi:hypothetical protein